MFTRKQLLVIGGLLLFAATFRVAVAHWLPNDAPDDGRVYAQFARNLLEQHVYSESSQAPFTPTYIRVPGYPLFVAGVYSIFGHTNNGAVRIMQALIDTASCGLIGLLAFLWQPDKTKKWASGIAALALAAVCPFTTIYSATILTEVLTMFLLVALCVAATIALRKTFSRPIAGDSDIPGGKTKAIIVWWAITGLVCGVAVLVRPDSGLFAAAVGATLLAYAVTRWRARWRKTVLAAALLSLIFALVLAPWTIRNWRVFHRFQPLAPTTAIMPGEFAPRGYARWLKTWIDDPYYVNSFWWSLDTDPIDIDDMPDSAFDSPEEKKRVAELFDKYNQTDEKDQDNSADDQKDSDDKSDQSDQDNTAPDESNSDQANAPDQSSVEMTPEIDAAFAQIAAERIARHPFRYYVLLPAKRMHALWFNTHSDYYPFTGQLFPLSDLDQNMHQGAWLLLFAALVAIYTLLGLAGGAVLWFGRSFFARAALLLVILIIASRLVLCSTLEAPESRYVVEFFPLLSALGGLAIAEGMRRLRSVSRN